MKKGSTLVDQLAARGFNHVPLKAFPGGCNMSSYNSPPGVTTVMRFENEKEDMFIAIGLMGQLHPEMTIGAPGKDMVYKKPLRELSDAEFDDILTRIKAGEVFTPKFFVREKIDNGMKCIMHEFNPEWI